MADNYLEKRYEEVFGNKDSKKVYKKNSKSLDSLLKENRSVRGYDSSYEVKRRQLETIVAVNTKIASARNQQALRFKLVTKENGAEEVMKHIRMGRALPELHLPFKGTEPNGFIVVCSLLPENKLIDFDLGISMQSMALKAVEMGLNGLMICNFDKNPIKEICQLPTDPIAILAVGKSIETIELVEINEGDDLNYYRKDGVHYVPKIKVEDIIL